MRNTVNLYITLFFRKFVEETSEGSTTTSLSETDNVNVKPSAVDSIAGQLNNLGMIIILVTTWKAGNPKSSSFCINNQFRIRNFECGFCEFLKRIFDAYFRLG